MKVTISVHRNRLVSMHILTRRWVSLTIVALGLLAQPGEERLADEGVSSGLWGMSSRGKGSLTSHAAS